MDFQNKIEDVFRHENNRENRSAKTLNGMIGSECIDTRPALMPIQSLN